MGGTTHCTDGASALAARAYAGLTDKAGEPLLAHAARVAASLGAAPAMVQDAALLHDAVEEGGATLDEVAEAAGAETARTVDALTRRGGETYASYIERVAADPVAASVKTADLRDNLDPARLAKLSEPQRSSLERRYVRALGTLTAAAPARPQAMADRAPADWDESLEGE